MAKLKKDGGERFFFSYSLGTWVAKNRFIAKVIGKDRQTKHQKVWLMNLRDISPTYGEKEAREQVVAFTHVAQIAWDEFGDEGFISMPEEMEEFKAFFRKAGEDMEKERAAKAAGVQEQK